MEPGSHDKGIALELGQLMFGNPSGDFRTPEYAYALTLGLLDEIERVYRNREQKEWDRYDDPKIEGVEFRPYYWGEDLTEAEKPNLKFAFSDQEIYWYKHPGRSMTHSLDWGPIEWCDWYDKAYELIGKADELD